MKEQYQTITVERIEAVVRICHNRPAALNAESSTLLRELDHAVRVAEADPEVRVMILGGKGRHFSAGHDLKEALDVVGIKPGSTVEERWAYESEYFFEYCLRILDMSKPTIAQVQGACIAGAFMVANMCDLIVASDDAYFADPVTHTLGTAAVEVLIHPYVLGMRKAKELLFTGSRLSASEAERIGMVNRVVARNELESATLALAQDISRAPPFALRLIKRSLNRVMDAQGLRVALSAHFDTHQLSHQTTEFKKTLESGLDKAIAQARNKMS
ncbi:MAG: enoyl-CoA hydratase [Pseudorhodoplanes sp.]|uniref:enoyl-CoA hydratase n=1 Tax=Pseudorhodoplanes sp. TaxID=1934341 RepID=UPI003D125663